jgi:phytanoyl-CoA hydroxylase
MWAVPGSHSTPTKYFLKSYFDIDSNRRVRFEGTEPNFNEEVMKRVVPIEVTKGSIVVFHGDLVHFSHANCSSLQRHAYTFHIIESQDCIFEKDNWLQRTDYPFDYLF